MPLVDRLLSWPRSWWWRLREASSTLNRPAPWLMGALGGSPGLSGQTVTPETAMRVAAVQSCVHVISDSMGCLPSSLFRRGADGRSRLPARDHQVHRLLSLRPNRHQTPYEFRAQMTTTCCLRGVAIAEKRLDARGRVDELVPLAAERTWLEQSLTQDELLVRHQPRRGAQRTLLAEEVLILRYFPWDTLGGYTPIRYAAAMIEVALAAQEHGQRLFSQAPLVSGWLKPKEGQAFDVKRAKEVLAMVQSVAAQRHNAWAIGMLPEDVDFAPLTIPPSEIHFLDTMRFSRGGICGLFRVPPHLIADLDRATFSNIEHQGLSWVSQGFLPWPVRWEQMVSRDLLLPDEREEYFLKFNFGVFLRGDQTARSAAHAQAIQNGWLSVNEVRELEDLNPIPSGDTHLMPSNLQPLAAALAMLTQASRPSDPAPSAEGGDE